MMLNVPVDLLSLPVVKLIRSTKYVLNTGAQRYISIIIGQKKRTVATA